MYAPVSPLFRQSRTCIPISLSTRSGWRRHIGLQVRDRRIKGDTGAYISAHAYEDQLRTEDDLARLREPEIAYDRAASEEALAAAREVFDGLMGVELAGCGALGYNIWDEIAVFRGAENLLFNTSGLDGVRRIPTVIESCVERPHVSTTCY